MESPDFPATTQTRLAVSRLLEPSSTIATICRALWGRSEFYWESEDRKL